jgi:hypothetical protein
MMNNNKIFKINNKKIILKFNLQVKIIFKMTCKKI